MSPNGAASLSFEQSGPLRPPLLGHDADPRCNGPSLWEVRDPTDNGEVDAEFGAHLLERPASRVRLPGPCHLLIHGWLPICGRSRRHTNRSPCV